MSTRTRAARRRASWQWMTRMMTSVFCAAGVAAALVMATPTAVADPEQDPGNPLPPAPVGAAPPLDPMAAPVPPPVPDVIAPPVDPNAPPPADPNAPLASGTPVAGQNPEPFTGTPPFRPPTFNPSNGSMVGVGKPIIINFAVPITDRPMAQQ